MNATQMNNAAHGCAEQTKGLDENSLEYHEAVATAFRATGNDPVDFETFKGMVAGNRGRILRLEVQRLPSEIAAAQAAKNKPQPAN